MLMVTCATKKKSLVPQNNLISVYPVIDETGLLRLVALLSAQYILAKMIIPIRCFSCGKVR